MSLVTDIETFSQTSEFTDDVSLITDLLVNAVALQQFVDSSDPFIHTVAYLCAIHRHYIKQMGLVKDIDQSPYLDLFRNEVGMGLPVISSIPMVEFIREAKSWGGHKGTLGLYKFIGQLIGSPIEVDVLNKKIMMLDDLDTRLDGGASDKGILPFNESQLGFIRDGIFYAHYTYQITVLQAQNLASFDDLYALLDNVHPAGFKEFLKFVNYHLSERDVLPSNLGLFSQKSTVSFFTYRDFPGLDNGLETDDLNSLLDTFLDLNYSAPIFIRDSRDNAFAQGHRIITQDSLLHDSIPLKPWAIFSRFKATNKDEDEDYTKIYPDEDQVLLFNQQTNMSFSELTYEEIENREFREIENIAYDKANQNPPTDWYRDLPMCTISDF